MIWSKYSVIILDFWAQAIFHLRFNVINIELEFEISGKRHIIQASAVSYHVTFMPNTLFRSVGASTMRNRADHYTGYICWFIIDRVWRKKDDNNDNIKNHQYPRVPARAYILLCSEEVVLINVYIIYMHIYKYLYTCAHVNNHNNMSSTTYNCGLIGFYKPATRYSVASVVVIRV